MVKMCSKMSNVIANFYQITKNKLVGYSIKKNFNILLINRARGFCILSKVILIDVIATSIVLTKQKFSWF